MKISIQKIDGSNKSFKTDDPCIMDVCNKVEELQRAKFFIFTDKDGATHCINTSEIVEVIFSDYIKECSKTILNEG